MARSRKVIDLFAGAGGATAGLKRAGFKIVGAVELDPTASETYRANHPEVQLIQGDIRSVSPRAWMRQLRLRPGSLALIKACPPCQSYSSLGANDEDDPRNALVNEVWRFISTFEPQHFILENVPGLRRDGRLGKLQRQARAIGYSVREYRIDAADFGVPQRRVRLIVIGSRSKQLPDDLLAALELLPASYSELRTAGEALKRIKAKRPHDPHHVHRQLTAAVAERVTAIPRGGDRFSLPVEYQLDCHTKLDKRNATASYGRIVSNQPAPTLTTRCTTPACGRYIHPTKNRGLTLREAATLQTFPLTYRFRGSYGEIERQIGNAVPVKLATALGLLLERLPDR